MKIFEWFRRFFSVERQLEKIDRQIEIARAKGIPVDDLEEEKRKLRKEYEDLRR